MITKKIALFGTAALFCAGLAMAQTPDPQHSEHHHADFAALHKSMCEDHAAHTAAKLAYVETKLNLTDAQKPLFAKWRQAVMDSAGKEKTACLAEPAPKPDARPTVLEHEQREEAMLSARLQMLQSSRPALEAFYNSLTDAQKDSFNRMHDEHMRKHMGMMHEGMGHEGPMHHPE